MTQKNQCSIFKDMPAKTKSAWPSQTHHTGTYIYDLHNIGFHKIFKFKKIQNLDKLINFKNVR